MVRYKRVMSIVVCLSVLLITVMGMITRVSALENGKVQKNIIRLGYVESEEYGSFCQMLLCIALELAEEGSIDADFVEKYGNVDYEDRFTEGDTRSLWNDICEANTKGARYRFVREAFFNLDEMDEGEYEQAVNRDDVDIILSMGTVSGVYLSEHENKNRFINMLSADPIASGIVKSETERFNDRTFALIDQTPYMRQIDAGHKFLGFNKLGVVYEDSESAYSYSAINVVEQKAKELGFEVVYEYVDEPVSDDECDRYYSELKQAYRKLADKGIDCLYITLASIDYEEKMQELLDDSIIPAGIKTLAQDELLPVANGVLFGVTLTDHAESANHVVTQLRRFAEEGVPFDQLDMVCEVTPRIGMNYTTAKRIGFEIPFADLQIIDEIYRNDAAGSDTSL